MHILASKLAKPPVMTDSQKFALKQCLKFWPSHRSFEDVLTMVRQGSINVSPLPFFAKKSGSLADYISQLEEQTSAFMASGYSSDASYIPKVPGSNTVMPAV